MGNKMALAVHDRYKRPHGIESVVEEQKQDELEQKHKPTSTEPLKTQEPLQQCQCGDIKVADPINIDGILIYGFATSKEAQMCKKPMFKYNTRSRTKGKYEQPLSKTIKKKKQVHIRKASTKRF